MKPSDGNCERTPADALVDKSTRVQFSFITDISSATMKTLRRLMKILVLHAAWAYLFFLGLFQGALRRVKYFSDRRMDGMTVLITGGGSGLGKVTAFDVARRGAKVILACLYMDEARKTQEEIINVTGNKNVIVKFLDVSCMEDVRRFAAELTKMENRLDVLVNNAGIGGCSGRTKADLVRVIATNYLGPFLLTHLLLDLLLKTPGSRVVNVASLAHMMPASRSMKYLTMDNRYTSYPYSKLYLIMFTMEMGKRLDGTGVTVNAMHPGVVSTQIFSNLNSFENVLLYPFRGALKTPEEGATTEIYLTVDENVKSITGKYFVDCEVTPVNTLALDPAFRDRLWETTEELLKLKPEEKVHAILQKNPKALKNGSL